jgi:uncharacterized membrane protein
MAHPHVHHDLPEGPPNLRRLVFAVLALVLMFAVIGLIVWWPRGDAPQIDDTRPYVDATVTSVRTEPCPGIEAAGALTECDFVEAEVTSGETVGDTARFTLYATDFARPELSDGDGVVLLYNAAAPAEFRYTYADLQRDTPLVLLAVIFAVAVIALGRWKGLRALVGIVISFGVILVFLLPSLLRENPAVPVALVATVIIAFLALYLAHGVNITTTVALLGTLASLGVIALLSLLFVHLAQLTGLAEEEAQVLRVTAEALDLRGLLIAGIIVGALGVLDDVTVTQVSAVAELRRANPDLSRWELYSSAVRIGRDHIASTVNTLVLAYAGASLPLLLLFAQRDAPWARIGASEIVAIEIVRTLVGSIGLVLSVPVTTGLAAALLTRPPAGGAAIDDAAPTPDTPTPDVSTPDAPPPDAEPGDRWDTFAPESKPW